MSDGFIYFVGRIKYAGSFVEIEICNKKVKYFYFFITDLYCKYLTIDVIIQTDGCFNFLS